MTARDEAFEAWRDRAAAADILDVAQSAKVGAKLKKRSREHSGPCPRCGGTDRFNVNPTKQVFTCRNAAGGNVISMVMHTCAVPFLAACEIITGEAPPAGGSQLTPQAKAEADRLKAESAAKAKRREADENLYRHRERRKTFDIFEHAHSLAGSSAAEYLALRGLRFPPTIEGRAERIKCVEAMPYHVGGGEDARIVHRGPAMVLPIVDAARKFRGLHFTYLDLSSPKGKWHQIDEASGDPFDPKKTRGSKRGNHVELIGPIEPTRLVLGEGAEKVIAVWQALDWRENNEEIGRVPLDQETAFWSACDLGNLAGAATDSLTHPTAKHKTTGRAQKVAGVVPDFNEHAIAIPDSVVDLVLLGDSTSDPFTTQCAMARACARYARPGLTVRVAWAPDGIDFDDPWRTAEGDAERAAWAEQICAIVDAAQPFAMPAIAASVITGDSRPSVGSGTDEKPSSVEAAIANSAEVGQGAAPARDSALQGAAQIEPHATGAGNAGAPPGLPSPDAGHSGGDAPDAPGTDPDRAAPRAAAPPAAPPAAAENKDSSRTGATKARSADRALWGGPPRKYGEGDDALDRWLATYPLTDLGNVERFVQRYRGALIYCAAMGWFSWDGQRWAREGAEARAHIAEHETVRAIQREAQAIAGTDQDIIVGGTEKEPIYLSDKLRAWGRASENASRLNPISKRAQNYLKVEPRELDADPFLINLANGTLIVRRGFSDQANDVGPDWRDWGFVSKHIRLKPHDPADLITKMSPVEWRAKAACSQYDALMDLVQPSKDVQRMIDDWDGYSLTGDASEQALVFHYGTGKNGKSTQIAIKLYIAGDYGRSIPIDTFAQEGRARQAGQATPDLAMLHRVRVLSTSEPKKGWRLDEALIKVLTGGDEVPVRELFAKTYFMLKPEFKLGMNGNHKPRIDGDEQESGMWRRVKLIPWKVKIPKGQRDKHFGKKLEAEASGILNRMLAGLERWMEKGLVDAAEVAAATEQFRQDSDPLGRFLEECTKPKGDGRAQTTQLYNLFVAWARARGETEWKSNGFSRAMTDRGFESKKSDLHYWLGIEITKKENDFVDHLGVALTGAAGSNRGDTPPTPRTMRARDDDGSDDVGF